MEFSFISRKIWGLKSIVLVQESDGARLKKMEKAVAMVCRYTF